MIHSEQGLRKAEKQLARLEAALLDKRSTLVRLAVPSEEIGRILTGIEKLRRRLQDEISTYRQNGLCTSCGARKPGVRAIHPQASPECQDCRQMVLFRTGT